HHEEHVQHAEQQQRSDQLPGVPEHRPEELQLELVARDVVGEVPEARPILGQSARAADRPAKRCGNRARAHAVAWCSTPARPCGVISVCTGTSSMPPLATEPVTTNEKRPL